MANQSDTTKAAEQAAAQAEGPAPTGDAGLDVVDRTVNITADEAGNPNYERVVMTYPKGEDNPGADTIPDIVVFAQQVAGYELAGWKKLEGKAADKILEGV